MSAVTDPREAAQAFSEAAADLLVFVWPNMTASARANALVVLRRALGLGLDALRQIDPGASSLSPEDVEAILDRSRRANTTGRRYSEGDEADVRDLVRALRLATAERDDLRERMAAQDERYRTWSSPETLARVREELQREGCTVEQLTHERDGLFSENASLTKHVEAFDVIGPLVAEVEEIAWSHDDECPHRHGCEPSCPGTFDEPRADGTTECDAAPAEPCDCSAGRVLALLAALRPLVSR